MQTKIIKNLSSKCLIIGAIYDQWEKLYKIKNILNNYEKIILNGNVFISNNLIDINNKIEILQQLLETEKFIYNLGSYDLLLLKQIRYKKEYNTISKWLLDRPNLIILEFKSQVRFIITNGGINNQKIIFSDIETSFISNINNKIWHNLYNGKIGYIISNNPLTSSPPKFYQYSLQMGNKYKENFKTYAQEIDLYGMKETFIF